MRALLSLLAATSLLAGCHKPGAALPVEPSVETTSPGGAISEAKPMAVKLSTAPPKARASGPVPAEIWKSFSGAKAFEHVRREVEIGPRPSGSAELEQVRGQILEVLSAAGWDTERQEFTDETPRGPMKFTNIIARFSATTARPAPATTQRAIVCSHYDTKRFSTIKFLGASDGASSTGALLELARVLALDPALASQVELVFFDGEEALVQFTETDGLYGSRHYAKSLRQSGRAAQFKFGVLWDMIGDSDLTITLSPDSPQPLTKDVLSASEALGVRSHFGYYDRSILDDHVPLNQLAHIPTVDLIDFDYLPWHTADDKLDKLSPESLQTVGAVTLFYLRQALAK